MATQETNMAAQDNRVTAPAPAAERVLTPIVWLGGAVSTLLLLLTFALTIYAVVMRYVVDQPVVWSNQLIGYLIVALVMFGGAEGYRRQNHIAVDLVTERLAGRARLAVNIWSDLCVLAFAIVLGISTYQSISFARMFGSYSPGAIQIQTWIPQVPMLIASILFGVFALARLADRLIEGGCK